MKKEKTVRFSVSLPEQLVQKFDEVISGQGGNRSRAIADLLAEKIVASDWLQPERRMAAAILLVYDHRQRELGEKLTRKQHHHQRDIISSMHIHLDHDYCLEIIVVRGKAGQLKELADELAAEKGIKYGRIFPADTGGIK